ncbi:MAG TPA: outer membrane protein assembly factor BamA [Gemmatimonadales bacterium]
MHQPWILGLALVAAGAALAPVSAQVRPEESAPAQAANCATPDTLVVTGNRRVTTDLIRTQIGFTPGAAITGADLQRSIRALFETGQFQDVRLACVIREGGDTALEVTVSERPLLSDVSIEGTSVVSERAVRDRFTFAEGLPLDPAAVARTAAAVDSLYEARGYYLSRVTVDTVVAPGSDGSFVSLVVRVDEGGRLAISGLEIVGNEQIPTEEIMGAMKTKPEGFLWFRRGAFDETEFAADVGQRIPALYASRGYIDAVVTQDTVVVDRELGKGLVRLVVTEGPQYALGRFDVIGNQHFSDEQIRSFYPFGDEGPTLTQRVTDILRRRHREEGVFDQERWEESTARLQEAYGNEGYLFARVQPVVERTIGEDSVPVVNLRWEVAEGAPAIINRVDIVGNDYTVDACIRRQLVLIPGQVFNRERLIRSWQSIANLGFFETPLPSPDIQPTDEGDVDVVFSVKEKRTGNVNFGASMGEGTGIGGFIGLDQPNLFGQCKRGSIQWQYGRYINDANVSYTDPAIGGSLVSGTVQAYNTRSRYYIGDLGRSTRTGGSVRVGFPFRRSNFTRVFVSYGGESVKFGDFGLLGRVDSSSAFQGSSFRSTLGLDLVRDTRVGMPFPVAGSTQSVSMQFNGGPLGGSESFQRYTGEFRGYAPVGSIGGGRVGSQPMEIVFGLSSRAGAVFGDPGRFFYSQWFTLGGVQYGEQLRGYEEFSIGPGGFLADSTSTGNASLNSFGSTFFTATAELGLRVNSSLYINTFVDAGNVWRRPQDFNPTRLFRGAGFGVSTVTPLGPLGLDYAYGFDRTERDPATGIVRPAPRWQFHFRLGQLF